MAGAIMCQANAKTCHFMNAHLDLWDIYSGFLNRQIMQLKISFMNLKSLHYICSCKISVVSSNFSDSIKSSTFHFRYVNWN